jgi:serine/threonine protein kinase
MLSLSLAIHGERFDKRFERLTMVGSGSMGTVYKAWDPETKAHVALKVLRARETHERFAREARVLASIEHEHMVRYVAHGVAATGEPWLAMEWLEGEDLATRLDRAPLTVSETLALAKGLAEALAWGHEKGLIHRDLKPSNLFLPAGRMDRVKVLDFGLARLSGQADAFQTATGTIMGTLDYMPPEQATDAKRVDARADIYSFGAVLFHCLAGRPPVTGRTTAETLANMLSQEVPLVSVFRPTTPAALVDLVAKMVSKNREARPKDGTAVKSALANVRLDCSTESLTTIHVAVDFNESRGLASQRAPVQRPDPRDQTVTAVMVRSPFARLEQREQIAAAPIPARTRTGTVIMQSPEAIRETPAPAPHERAARAGHKVLAIVLAGFLAVATIVLVWYRLGGLVIYAAALGLPPA